jgi:hypothetical protein
MCIIKRVWQNVSLGPCIRTKGKGMVGEISMCFVVCGLDRR